MAAQPFRNRNLKGGQGGTVVMVISHSESTNITQSELIISISPFDLRRLLPRNECPVKD